MSMLFNCGLCCILLSIWAVIQLIVMGIFFKMEVLAFIEEAEPDHNDYEDYDDFMKKTKENYQLVQSPHGVNVDVFTWVVTTLLTIAVNPIAVNCWVGAAIYFVFVGISWLCIKKAKSIDLNAAETLKEDEEFCADKIKNL